MPKKAKLGLAVRSAAVDAVTAREFSTIIGSLAVHLDEIRHYRAKSLGISGPQFAILMTIRRLDEGDGVSVRHVAGALHVDSSFITTQSKVLEKKGLLGRQTDETDARVVKLFLTDKAEKQITGLAAGERSLNAFIFGGLTNDAVAELTDQLTELSGRLEKACLKIAGGF
ncbi:MarR family winged helix-turn-helix transcriptional regulator [Rhodopseudomonas sp. HC1]|uniref:MarR family winged helix-turn-helix transcriptional regulator n=1 Tax=Rhodopseudomonas infernalis TaxID=2897386 RepID=UPI001EE8C650|nr:MarR family winged helix-turn-helix transcriptional regulator [Rhodopseudomonas infernalis]MCG6205774.1 MarR family winged helix-turn-helix transcriptional regulator [Rhodopseudomonas infernalis]